MAEASGSETPAGQRHRVPGVPRIHRPHRGRTSGHPADHAAADLGAVPGGTGPEALAKLIAELQREDDRFHMEGGSWTNDISWVRGYDHVLGPMEDASALFAEKVLGAGHRRIPATATRSSTC